MKKKNKNDNARLDPEPRYLPTETWKPTMIPLADIELDPALQVRTKLDPGAVRQYAEHYAAVLGEAEGRELTIEDFGVADVSQAAYLPPISIWEADDGRLVCVDGHHRLRAAEIAGLPSVPCVRAVLVTDRMSALGEALAANNRNGVRLTIADKRRAVRLVVEANPSVSDRRVAEVVGVSPTFVGKVRSLSTVDSETTKRVGKDGRVIETSKIGQRPPEPARASTWPSPELAARIREEFGLAADAELGEDDASARMLCMLALELGQRLRGLHVRGSSMITRTVVLALRAELDGLEKRLRDEFNRMAIDEIYARMREAFPELPKDPAAAARDKHTPEALRKQPRKNAPAADRTVEMFPEPGAKKLCPECGFSSAIGHGIGCSRDRDGSTAQSSR